jgi:malonate transporter
MAVTILLALAPIFFILAVGYGAGRLHVVDNRNVDSLNVLVMTFALPAALFVATASAPRSELLEQVPLFVILSLVMLAVHLGWYALARRFWQASKADAALQALTISFPNLAAVGLPIASASGNGPGRRGTGVGLDHRQPLSASFRRDERWQAGHGREVGLAHNASIVQGAD